jgi:hypothetical protein
MTELRIQRKRNRPWWLTDTVYVGRPSRYGNPFVISKNMDREESLKRFEMLASNWSPEFLEPLIDKNLACWCKLCKKHKDGKPLGEECPDCEKCHADIIFKMIKRIKH